MIVNPQPIEHDVPHLPDLITWWGNQKKGKADLHKIVYEFFNRKLPGRNDKCYCGSGKKFKKCHA